VTEPPPSDRGALGDLRFRWCRVVHQFLMESRVAKWVIAVVSRVLPSPPTQWFDSGTDPVSSQLDDVIDNI